MRRYVLLLRHSDHQAALEDGRFRRRLTKKGKDTLTGMADRLAEVLRSPAERIELAMIRCAPSDEAKETAEVVRHRVGSRVELIADIDLSTDHMDLYRDSGWLDRFVQGLLGRVTCKDHEVNQRRALLIVGHQPMLGWLAHALTATAYPLSRSELLCIAVDAHGRGKLQWVLSPTDDELVRQLRDKIKSKMDVAKVLSGFITAGLSFLLASLVDPKRIEVLGDRLWAAYVSASLFFVSIGLYLATMYAYDTLLMPSRFWGESPQNAARRPGWIVARPPSSVQWILYQNMVRIWLRLFTPATLCVLAGFYFLAFAVMTAVAKWPCFDWWFFGVGIVGLVILVLAYVGGFRRFTGPWVGSED